MKIAKNNLNSLKIGGIIETDRDKIEDEVLSYFGALFNGRHNKDLVDSGVSFVPDYGKLDEILRGLGKLSDQEKENMTKDFTKDEIDWVLKDTDSNKSPGVDGLPYEFYKAVWELVGGRCVEDHSGSV